ncbi:Uridylate kinase [bioreactor metagenome]|uniref:Uridylate kinase n=1 Tax=bioreactor metagenome TaxID=1076179 RepID=A0A644W203_9ZZZZ
MKRILLKLSGESLAGAQGSGIESGMLALFAEEIVSAVNNGAEVGVVLGGGNIFRGLGGSKKGVSRVQGDYMGMLATVINSLALQDALKQRGVNAEVLSGLEISPLCRKMSSTTAIELLNSKTVVIMAGGTGNPYFTTDSAAALRAVEIEADALLKGTRVDGIYTADPEKNPDAVKFDELTFDEAYEKHLNIMDMTAFTLCRENNMPVIVFDIHEKGNLAAILSGKKIGTLVKN